MDVQTFEVQKVPTIERSNVQNFNRSNFELRTSNIEQSNIEPSQSFHPILPPSGGPGISPPP